MTDVSCTFFQYVTTGRNAPRQCKRSSADLRLTLGDPQEMYVPPNVLLFQKKIQRRVFYIILEHEAVTYSACTQQNSLLLG